MSGPHIRWMIRKDLPEVLDIERESFPNPWTEEDFLRCLRFHRIIGMVVERDDRIVGYMLYELHLDRIHILNFVVSPECRRERIGERMQQKLAGKLSANRRTKLVLQIVETNLAGQLFWREMGYRVTGIIHGHYVMNDADAYVMEFEHRRAEFAPTNRISKQVSQ